MDINLVLENYTDFAGSPPRLLIIDSPLGRVGMTEREAQEVTLSCSQL